MRAFGTGIFEDCDWASHEGDFGEGKGGDSVGKELAENGVAFGSTEVEPGNRAEKIDGAEDDEQGGAEVDLLIEDFCHLVGFKELMSGLVPRVG